jgi:hypothetical protein
MEIFNAAAQRAALLEFGKALGSRDNALRRDECGDPAIFGTRGHIYACPGGTASKPDPKRPSFQVMVSGASVGDQLSARPRRRRPETRWRRSSPP